MLGAFRAPSLSNVLSEATLSALRERIAALPWRQNRLIAEPSPSETAKTSPGFLMQLRNQVARYRRLLGLGATGLLAANLKVSEETSWNAFTDEAEYERTPIGAYAWSKIFPQQKALQSPEYIAHLEGALRSPSEDELSRWHALESASRYPTQVDPEILETYLDSVYLVERVWAAKYFMARGEMSPRVEAVLIEALSERDFYQDWEGRGSYRYHYRSPLDDFFWRTVLQNPRTRAAVVETLGRQNQSWWYSSRIYHFVGTYRLRELESPIVASLEYLDVYDSFLALKTLRRFDEDKFSGELPRYAKSTRPEVRMAVAMFLGENAAYPHAETILKDLYRDPEDRVFREALTALKKWPTLRNHGLFMEVAGEYETFPLARKRAFFEIFGDVSPSFWRGPALTALSLKELESSDMALRRQAASILDYSSAHFDPLLVPLLDDPQSSVRHGLSSYYNGFSNPLAVFPLTHLMTQGPKHLTYGELTDVIDESSWTVRLPTYLIGLDSVSPIARQESGAGLVRARDEIRDNLAYGLADYGGFFPYLGVFAYVLLRRRSGTENREVPDEELPRF